MIKVRCSNCSRAVWVHIEKENTYAIDGFICSKHPTGPLSRRERIDHAPLRHGYRRCRKRRMHMTHKAPKVVKQPKQERGKSKEKW